MGTWSTDIFGNDLSCDVRDSYGRHAADVGTIDKALKLVKREFAVSLQDDIEKWVVWIALAASQLETGAVLDEVREQALKAISWCEGQEADSELFPFSLDSLADLKQKLGGPAPRNRKVRPKVSPGNKGDVLAIRFPNSAGEAVIVLCGHAGNDRPSHYGRVVLLLDLPVEAVSPERVNAALSAWRPFQRVWHDGPSGRVIGCYDASGKLPARKTKLLLSGVSFPDEFERRMQRLAETYNSSELPHIIEYDVGEWKRAEWAINPRDQTEEG